jgi:antirestriction protein ArdC
MNNDNIYQEVTDRIIAQLEKGTVPWRKPWSSAYEGFSGQPQNLVSRKAYRGINSLILGTAGFDSPWWLTFNQCRELGGNIKKGSKSNLVVFFKKLNKTDAKGNPVYDNLGREVFIPLLRYSRVFNSEQCEGLTLPTSDTPIVEGDAAESDESHIAKAKKIAKEANLCPIKNGGDSASYSPTLDVIKMPKVKDFNNPATYYHTLFHEMVHATGHKSRLNRFKEDKVAAYGGEDYSKEELVAEMGASFVSNIAGILDQVQFEQSAAYIANWLEALKHDHKFVVKAATAAQRAADLILHVK